MKIKVTPMMSELKTKISVSPETNYRLSLVPQFKIS